MCEFSTWKLFLTALNVPSLPSREQERAAGGVKLLTLGASLHCRAPQLDDGPATWLSWPRMTYELWHCVSSVRRTAAKRLRCGGLVYCLFMPGWILTWFSYDICRIMKEHNEGIMGCSCDFSAPVFREPFNGRWLALATLRVHEQHPVGCYWAQREKRSTVSVMTISAFYLWWEFVCSSHF